MMHSLKGRDTTNAYAEANTAISGADATLLLDLGPLLDSPLIAAAVSNEDGVLTSANDTLLDMIGRRRGDIDARAIRWSDVTVAEHRPLDERAAEELMRSGTAHPYRKDLIRPDGARIPVVCSTTATSTGRFMTLIVRAEGRHSDSHLPIQYAITHILNESPTIEAAGGAILDRVGRDLGWDFGALWTVDESGGTLRCSHTWQAEGRSYDDFVAITASMRPAAGTGLAGRVWQSRRSLWISDLTSEELPRRSAAVSAGFHTAIGFPVMAAGEPSGVIEYFSRRRVEEDESLLALFAGIGGQLGQCIERTRAERAILDGAERFRAMIENSWEAVALIGADGTLLYSSPSGARLLGYTPDAIAGHNAFELIHPADLLRTRRLFERLKVKPGGREIAEYRYRHSDGRWIWVEASATNMLDEPSLGAIVVNYRDITERRTAEEQTRFLAEAASLLGETLDRRKTMHRVVDLIVPYFADWCMIDMLHADGTMEFMVAHADPARRALGEEIRHRYPIRQDSHIYETVTRTRRAIVSPDAPGDLERVARGPEHLAIIRSLGLQSYIVAPLVARGEVIGIINFFVAESQRRYSERDLALAIEIANRASIAIDNARLFEAEQRARREAEEAADRTRRLQEITVAFSEASSSRQVTEILLREGIASLSAAGGILALLNEGTEGFSVAGALGFGDQIVRGRGGSLAPERTPIADALRSGKPVRVAAHEELAERYPHLADDPVAARGACCVLPLIVDGRVIGALYVAFDGTRHLSEHEESFALALTRQSAQALERTRLYEAERRARAEADAAARRSAFLAEASKVLAGSLDVETTAKMLSRLAVPALADLCIVDLIRTDGSFHPPVVSARDREREDLVRAIHAPRSGGHAVADGFRSVIRTGQPELGSDLTQLEAGDDRRRILERLGLDSYVCVPLEVRDEILGTITLAVSGGYRRYDDNDLALVEDLAARVAMAIDNARLYRMAQEELVERKRTERALVRSNARFLRLFESNVIGIIVTNLDGSITEANDAFLAMIGYSREDLREGNILWLKMTPATYYVQERRAVVESRATGAFTPFEKEFVRRDGSKVPVMIGGATLGEEGEEFICFVVDLTDRKRAEQERGELLRREQSARKEAETANRLKDEFLATVSHELRTPLNAILGWVQLLRGGDLDEATAARALETIERNAKAQTQIIEDILDVSRIVSGKLRLEMLPVHLPAAINGAIDAVRLAAEAKQISMEVDDGAGTPPIMGDAQRLQQIVWNLLCNAIKFTPEGGHVRVEVINHRRNAEIRVVDDGKGIPGEFLPYVFDRFRQADGSNTRPHGGLGLGLAIVRHLVELHGGSVSAHSNGYGTGATFVVNLPLSRQADRADRTVSSGAAPELEGAPGHDDRRDEDADVVIEALRGTRVLLVDDEIDTLEMLEAAFEGAGAEPRTASSAAEAYTIFRSWRPDLLISDIGMPEEDGYSLIDRIRAYEDGRGLATPAIALTAYARSEDRTRALDAGFSVHIAKPVEPAELVRTSARLIAPAPAGRPHPDRDGTSAGRTKIGRAER